MRSSFFEFHVASSALFTARMNMDVASHNIANTGIKGYSRQYAEQRASWPMLLGNGKGMVGSGSEIYGVGQLRSFYLDKKYWSERGVQGEYGAKKTQLAFIQNLMNELSDTGITGAFDRFCEQLQELSQKSDDPTYRTNLLQVAQNLTTLVNNTAKSLQRQQEDINSEIASVVDTINSYGVRIKSLNEQIRLFELDGSKANDLRDERARMVDELSKIVNVDVYEVENNQDYADGKYPNPEDRGKSDKRFIVLINGYELVNNNYVNKLTVEKRQTPKNEMDVPGLYDIKFESGNTFDMYHPNLKGELKGLIDMRDGNNGVNYEGLAANSTTVYKGIPHYMNKLNNLVRVFTKAFNEGMYTDTSGTDTQINGISGHTKGYDKNNELGKLFFTFDKNVSASGYNPADTTNAFYNQFNCINFQVNTELITYPEKVATKIVPGLGESDNNLILGLSGLKSFKSLFREGKISDYIVGLTVELGIDYRQADNFDNNYTQIITMIDYQRESISIVDPNEEMIEIVKQEQLFAAASALINAIDKIYDTLINLGNF